MPVLLITRLGIEGVNHLHWELVPLLLAPTARTPPDSHHLLAYATLLADRHLGARVVSGDTRAQ